MQNNVVSISPIPAHFLLRSPLEQAIMVGAALAMACPWMIFGLVGLVAANGHGDTAATVFFVCMLCALLFGLGGWIIGRTVANVVCLLRARRAQRELAKGGAR